MSNDDTSTTAPTSTPEPALRSPRASARDDLLRMLSTADDAVRRVMHGLDAQGIAVGSARENMRLDPAVLRHAAEQLRASATQVRAYAAELDNVTGQLEVLSWAVGELS